jgi:hypothetical protein
MATVAHQKEPFRAVGTWRTSWSIEDPHVHAVTWCRCTREIFRYAPPHVNGKIVERFWYNRPQPQTCTDVVKFSNDVACKMYLLKTLYQNSLSDLTNTLKNFGGPHPQTGAVRFGLGFGANGLGAPEIEPFGLGQASGEPLGLGSPKFGGKS